MIVVSITSWPPRVEGLKRLVENLKKQTIKPDRIIVTLYKREWKEIPDLPGCEINFIDENLKTKKKMVPLEYLPDDDWVVLLDDDFDYPDNIIEELLNASEDDNPVTGSHYLSNYRPYGEVLSAAGAYCLIKPKHCKKYLKDILLFAKKRMLEVCGDVPLTYATLLSGYHFCPTEIDYRKISSDGPQPYSHTSNGLKRIKQSYELCQKFIRQYRLK